MHAAVGIECDSCGIVGFVGGSTNYLLSIKTIDGTVPDPYYLDKKVKLVELFSYHKLGLTNKYTHLFGDS